MAQMIPIVFVPEPEIFNSDTLYREMGYFMKQHEQTRKSLRFFDTALEKNQTDGKALLLRADTLARCCKYAKALNDIKKLDELNPDDPLVAMVKAMTTFLNCDFEEALIQNANMLRLRKKPDNFSMGVMHCKNAILNCIGARAGHPLRDYFKFIRKVAWKLEDKKMLDKKYLTGRRRRRIKKAKKNENVIVSPRRFNSTRLFKSKTSSKLLHSGKKLTSVKSVEQLESQTSVRLLEKDSSIRSSLNSHKSSKLLVPPPPKFPYKPLQDYTSNISNYMSEKYLEKMYLDKLFLKELVKRGGIETSNVKGSQKILSLVKHGYNFVSYNQELLRSRRPFYFLKYQEVKASAKLKERQELLRKKLQNTIQKEMNHFMDKIKEAYVRDDMDVVIELGDKLRNYLDKYTRKTFPAREDYLISMYEKVCDAYIMKKKLKPSMTSRQRKSRVHEVLGLPPSKESYREHSKQAYKKLFVDWRKYILIYQDRVRNATYVQELTWEFHELARFHLEIKSFDLARVYARRCIQKANLFKNYKWIINALFLMIKIEVTIRSKNEAKVHLKCGRDIAIKMNDPEILELIDKCTEAIDHMAFEESKSYKLVQEREKQIIAILPTDPLKTKAEQLFKRISYMPPQRRISVMPGFNPSLNVSSSSSNIIYSKGAKKIKEDFRGITFMDLIKYHID